MVGGKGQEEHDFLLEEVLGRMWRAGLCLNKKKCQLRVFQVTDLGHKISVKSLKSIKETTETNVEAPPPGDKKSLKSWLAL